MSKCIQSGEQEQCERETDGGYKRSASVSECIALGAGNGVQLNRIPVLPAGPLVAALKRHFETYSGLVESRPCDELAIVALSKDDL